MAADDELTPTELINVTGKRNAAQQARAAAVVDCPEAAGLWLRDMRKFAGQLAPSLAEASKLLQHSSLSVTQRHYRQGEKLTPVR